MLRLDRVLSESQSETEKLIKRISKPEELLKVMEPFEYGWIYKRKRYDTFDDFFVKNYRLMQPDQVLTYKTGVCQDQALFTYYVLSQLGYECRLCFIQQYYTSTHTYCLFKRKDKWYRFENSFAKFRGIHGPYKKPEDSAPIVYANMESVEKGGKGYLFQEVDVDKLLDEKDIDIIEYLLIVGYDFKKQESPK